MYNYIPMYLGCSGIHVQYGFMDKHGSVHCHLKPLIFKPNDQQTLLLPFKSSLMLEVVSQDVARNPLDFFSRLGLKAGEPLSSLLLPCWGFPWVAGDWFTKASLPNLNEEYNMSTFGVDRHIYWLRQKLLSLDNTLIILCPTKLSSTTFLISFLAT